MFLIAKSGYKSFKSITFTLKLNNLILPCCIMMFYVFSFLTYLVVSLDDSRNHIRFQFLFLFSNLFLCMWLFFVKVILRTICDYPKFQLCLIVTTAYIFFSIWYGLIDKASNLEWKVSFFLVLFQSKTHWSLWKWLEVALWSKYFLNICFMLVMLSSSFSIFSSNCSNW